MKRQALLNTKYQALLILAVILILGVAISSLPRLNKNTFLEPSTASLSIQNSKLHVDFDIAKNDQEELKAFSSSLGIGSQWAQGISVNLDQDTLVRLSPSLPTTVNLKIKEKEISFSNSSLPSLESALPGESYEFSTASGKLTLKTSGNSVKLDISDPEPLLHHATNSGQFNLSPQLKPLFPILSKIATIKIEVSGKVINGSVVLK